MHRKTESQPILPVEVWPWRKPNVKLSAWSEARIRKALSAWLEERGLSRSRLLISPVDDYARVQYILLCIQEDLRVASADARKSLRDEMLKWVRLSDQLWKRVATGGELRQPRIANRRPTPTPAPPDPKVTPIRSRWEG